MTTKATIELPNGYNGDKVLCFAEPIARDGSLVKLRVVGSTYLIRWAHESDLLPKPAHCATVLP